MKIPPPFGAWFLVAALGMSALDSEAAVNVSEDRVLAASDHSLDGQEVVVTGATLTVAGAHTFAGLVLTGNAVLNHPAAPNGESDHAVRLTVTGDVRIGVGSRINVSGLGYAVEGSPGAGTRGSYSGGGGGHGGRGATGGGSPGGIGGGSFGSILDPNVWGGAGGKGGDETLSPGGGLVQLEVGGLLTLDGEIRADGRGALVNNQGGGAGGSVWLRAATIRGSGLISADGGPGEWVDGGGGSGGRVAVRYGRYEFTGIVRAQGAGGSGVGGAGTVFLQGGTDAGEVRIANGTRGEWTPIMSPAAFDLEIAGEAVVNATEPLSIRNLTLTDNALLTHATGRTGLVVSATGNVLIGTSAAVSADGRGYPFDGQRGPGSGVRKDWAGSGAGHGGWGGHSATREAGGMHYGSVLQPTTLGSQGGDSDGGAGAAGGGAIRLVVGGTLQVDGRLSVDGLNCSINNAGGGSGGSLWVTAARLTGAGAIHAHGGNGEWVDGGGGSGGRIALELGTDAFTGSVAAMGGGGSERAGAGTIYRRLGGEARGRLRVDNGNNWGNYTPLGSPEVYGVVLTGRAQAYPEGPLELKSLDLLGEAVLTHLTGQTNLQVHVLGDALIDTNAQVSASARGYPIGEDLGPGAGNRESWAGSGGGHGGLGGVTATGAVAGRNYGSILEPILLGSAGGSSDGGAGTPGGGAIRLIVDGKLTVNGRLSADGGVSPPNNVGGGSGGSVYLTVGTLAGTGAISANGGPGEWVDGGGGGGGRIAIYFGTDEFAGAISAVGGGGYQRGGAGTLYFRKHGASTGRVLVSNGGTWGSYTPMTSPEAFELVLAEMAYVYPEAALTLGTLEVRTNATLTHLTGQARCEVNVIDDAVIDEGGAIDTSGRGYPVGEDRGPGAGSRLAWSGSGAGHGGTGGRGATGPLGGGVYGSMVEPLTAGSQGGDSDGGAGAAGGGVIRLVVGGQLTVDGWLNANGLNASINNTGGGSGGSVYITAGGLSGAGVISVDGGNGEWVDGGGGAGGRIALHLGAQSFAGSVRAQGGGGSARGGAGTIYTRTGGETGGELVLNNGGNAGALSPLEVPPGTRLVLTGGGTVFPLGMMEVVSLRLESGATLTHLNSQTGLDLHVTGDLTVDEGAAITASGLGYPVGDDPGPGAGATGANFGGGGAYGGNGGVAYPGDILGGVGYGSVIEPTDFGSSGGSGDGSANPRSPGGGRLRLRVDGQLTLNGAITADGTSAWYNNQGGGAGGSIWITAGTLAGAGVISANGGIGEWVDGGAGGGGRVALYLGTDSFEGTVSAAGGRSGRQPGGAGTVYEKVGAAAVGRVLVDNGDVAGAPTPLFTEEAFHLTLARRAQGYPEEALLVSSLWVATNSVLTHLHGQESCNALVLGNATIEGVVDVAGRGYPIGFDAGPGAGGRVSWSGGGAGHGGAGGTGRTGSPGGAAYGSQLQPTTRGSQGGSGDGGAGGAGGGAVRLIVGDTLTVDGGIRADGLNGTANNSGGGSGGSIFLSTRHLGGAGFITANGGAGEWVDGGGGAGGRIALYRSTSSFEGTITATGLGGSAPGEDGTIYEASVPMIVWLAPAEDWVHGEVDLDVALFSGSGGPLRVVFSAWREGGETLIAETTSELAATAAWDTAGFADGTWELRVVARNAAGALVAESRRRVVVNNAVVWRGGHVLASETWEAGQVHVVQRDLTIPSGVTLTLAPGAVVKFLPGIRLVVQGGGTIEGLGTGAQPTVLTSFLDDSAGGDSNLDGDATRPTPGAWRYVLNASGHARLTDQTRMRFQSQSYGGTLAGSETWTADSLREITRTVVVPDGVTLRLEAGAIVKFATGQGLDVQRGGALIGEGTVADPVVMTSLLDDLYGGDTNDDGARTRPGAGDWRSLRFEDGASGRLDHVVIRYGGNSVGNPWGAGGAIEALGGPLTVRNSLISDALKDGAFCYGTTLFENCLILRCDRGLTAVGDMQVIHCTVDECRIGLLEHVGQLTVRNSIVSRSIDVGISHDLGGGTPVVTACNVWNPDARQGNYSGTDDRTGRDGNLSEEPRYQDAEVDNFRLNFASPGIDAADGGFSPVTDYAGTPRYDDPRTGNTGTPAANGAVPDMGAFEFAETAPSNLDLVVAGINGPASLTAGETVHLEWIVMNRGTEAFSGPWHDALYLVDAANGRRIAVAEPLVGRSATLGPGQVYRAAADVRVPGGVVGDYRWTIETNSRGDVFEGANAGNNELSSESSASLTVPELPLDGAAVAGVFAAQEEAHWFRCVAPAGKDVRIDLDLLADTGITEIYVGRGFLPTPENFTARQREFGAVDTSAIASAGIGGGESEFYVLAMGRVLASTPESFAIGATSAAFSVESAGPARVGNSGLVTLEIFGSGLRPETTFSLRLGTEERTAIRQSLRESGRVFATFDLAGLGTGPATVVAGLGGLTASLPSGVEVVEGGTGDFYAELEGPGTTRAGRFTTWFVTYGNRGLVDIPLPLLRFLAPGATEIELFESTLNWADSFNFLALNPAVLLPTLGPGQEVTFEVRVKALAATTVELRVVPGATWTTSPLAFNWTSLAAPAGADAVRWSEWVGGLSRRLGATVAEYAARLDQDLEELRDSPIHYSHVANVNGRWLFGSEGDDYGEEIPIIEVPPEEEDPSAPGLHGRPAAPARIPGDGIRKTWWVVITIEDYSNLRRPDGSGAKDLPGTRVDAVDLWDYMSKDTRVPDDQIFGGHDDPATASAWNRANILAEIAKLKGKVDADDNVVIVFSGHGGRTRSGAGYLCGNGGYISPVAFTSAIDEIGAGTTYFLNDSCHSEAFNAAVNPSNTTFVGMAATMADRTSRDTAHGGELISNLKLQLRRCRSLGRSFEITEAYVSRKYENDPTPRRRQHPVLTNPSGASLEGKPWNDPSGFEQELKRAFDKLVASAFAHQALNIVGSVDPNDKYALAGAGPEHWVHPNQALPFEIVFENKTNAAAPAQEVLVIDDLDPRYDWSTFELKSLAFNDTKLTVPAGLQRYTATTTVGSDPNEVAIDVSFNPATGRISWLLRSVDAATGDLPEDPFAGFLPPNDALRRGEGSLTYTVRPLAGLPDGTRLTNQATIIFDPTYGANPPILTPVVTNTIDGLPPSSAVDALEAQVTGEFAVTWSGGDADGGSGIASYDVYVARDDEPYSLWQIATEATTATFLGQPGSTYRFYSVARDAAGNTEAAPEAPDAVTTIAGGLNFATWANSQGLPVGQSGPDDDPDRDGLPNFLEYALALQPMHADAASAAPVAGIAEVAGQRYLTLTYRRPKTEPSDVRYRVTTSSTLVPWSGNTVGTAVGEPVDHGDYVEVTVRTPEPMSGRAQAFLRLRVER